jgi:NHL repeat
MKTLSMKLLPLLVTLVPLICAGNASAEAPVKLSLHSRQGWEVNATTKANVCTVECQSAVESSEPGGFSDPESVATAAGGEVYVVDKANFRVQEFSTDGEFVTMFGDEVNKTTKGDICTAAEIKSAAVKCGQGVEGVDSGAFASPQGIAVEPAGTTEDVYVEDAGNLDIDKYTPEGVFVLRIGKEVNETTKGDICTAASHDKCGAGVQGEGPSEPGAFDFERGPGVGDQLAMGPGPEHLLYVGDHDRIQEFNSSGESKGEIELPSAITETEPGGITGIAIDDSSDIVYVVYDAQSVIHEFNISSKTEEPGVVDVPNSLFVTGIAADASGHLAIADLSAGEPPKKRFLYVYEESDGDLIGTSAVPPNAENISAISFSEHGNLYGTSSRQEVLGYDVLPVGEFKTDGGDCAAGPERESSDTFDCVLRGEVNPYEIAGTEASFEWGKTCEFGANTATQSLGTVETVIPLEATLENVRPNETICYRVAGHDQNAQLPEILAGQTESLATSPVPPKILSTSASFVTSSSAVLSAELNPENAPTEYYFEVAAEPEAESKLASCHNAKQGNCSGVATTATAESSAYGKVGTTLESTGLRPDAIYRYRLNADNYQDTQAELRGLSEEKSFETGSIPVLEAFTGPASDVTQTSAQIGGAVNPDGALSAYTFELGVYQGSATQYSIVASGSTGTGTVAEPESFGLTGLQPGVTYAYRIAVSSGYGSAQGAPMIFTTGALPLIISSPVAPALLPLPDISFPKAPVTCKRGYKLNKQSKCVKNKAKPKPKSKRKSKTSKGKKKK